MLASSARLGISSEQAQAIRDMLPSTGPRMDQSPAFTLRFSTGAASHCRRLANRSATSIWAIFCRDLLHGILELHAKHGPIAAVQDGQLRESFIFSPELNQQVLSDTTRYHARFFAVRGPEEFGPAAAHQRPALDERRPASPQSPAREGAIRPRGDRDVLAKRSRGSPTKCSRPGKSAKSATWPRKCGTTCCTSRARCCSGSMSRRWPIGWAT